MLGVFGSRPRARAISYSDGALVDGPTFYTPDHYSTFFYVGE